MCVFFSAVCLRKNNAHARITLEAPSFWTKHGVKKHKAQMNNIMLNQAVHYTEAVKELVMHPAMDSLGGMRFSSVNTHMAIVHISEVRFTGSGDPFVSKISLFSTSS